MLQKLIELIPILGKLDRLVSMLLVLCITFIIALMVTACSASLESSEISVKKQDTPTNNVGKPAIPQDP